MKKSLYVPAIIAVVVLGVWFFVPSSPFCSAFGVTDINCSSWTSGLFGVGLGGVLTLWASWYFGDKSSEDIAARINTAVDAKLQDASKILVSHMEDQLKQAAESLTKSIPSKTVDAMEVQTGMTLLFAGAPLLAKAIPGLVNFYSQIKPPTPTASADVSGRETKSPPPPPTPPESSP